jgi:hypothetical protein
MRSMLSRLFGSQQVTFRTSKPAPQLGRSFRPRLEGLEDRAVPSASPIAPPALGPALVAPAALTNPLTITGLNVTNLAVTGANTLTATLDVVGQVAGHAFTIPNVQVPITLSPPVAGSPILHLSLQIPDLNLLGLHVQLDNCNNGPVTVDVTAIPSGLPGGGLLGDLLSGVNGLLSGSGGLLNLGGQTSAVTGALTQVLNGVLGSLITSGTNTGGGSQAAAPQHNRTDLINLHLDSIHLNVLGLDVLTSPICLDVYAQRGGGILGDLLSNIDRLLSHNNPGNALNALTNDVLGILNGLHL